MRSLANFRPENASPPPGIGSSPARIWVLLQPCGHVSGCLRLSRPPSHLPMLGGSNRRSSQLANCLLAMPHELDFPAAVTESLSAR